MTKQSLTEIPGWPVMHLYYRIDRARWRSLPDQEQRGATDEFGAWLRAVCAEDGLQFVPMAGVAKSDVAFMAVHPDVRRVQRLGQEITRTAFGACLQPTYSFLSLSEVSEYTSSKGDFARQLVEEGKIEPGTPEFAAALAGFDKRMAAYADARVHPQLPTDMPVICFYPMSKARGERRNWYTLPFEERKKLMGGHAVSGRRHAGRVTQLVTSCTGIDDWEWGVTLFAHDLKSIRDVVYEMRYDEGSALYGQFGQFYVAIRFSAEDFASVLCL